MATLKLNNMGEVKYCKSYRCKECVHYVKFLTCNTMPTICWNKNNWFKEK